MSKFIEVFDELQNGNLIGRKSWDKGCFIFAQVPSEIDKSIIPKMTSLPPNVKVELERRGKNLNYKNQIAFVDGESNICGWTPSVSDLSGDDWFAWFEAEKYEAKK